MPRSPYLHSFRALDPNGGAEWVPVEERIPKCRILSGEGESVVRLSYPPVDPPVDPPLGAGVAAPLDFVLEEEELSDGVDVELSDGVDVAGSEDLGAALEAP